MNNTEAADAAFDDWQTRAGADAGTAISAAFRAGWAARDAQRAQENKCRRCPVCGAEADEHGRVAYQAPRERAEAQARWLEQAGALRMIANGQSAAVALAGHAYEAGWQDCAASAPPGEPAPALPQAPICTHKRQRFARDRTDAPMRRMCADCGADLGEVGDLVASSAPPAAPVLPAEPVAWQYRHYFLDPDDEGWGIWHTTNKAEAEFAGRRPNTEVRALYAAPPAAPIFALGAPTFSLGDRVRKTKGSSWQGVIVGTYSTTLTPEGYAVESEREPGSVQIYPVTALERIDG